MPVIINASPTNGLVQTADGSGIVKLQSNGVTTNALAWVNFVGSSGTRNASYNVSSVTRNGTGDYTVTFASALTDANYAALVSGIAGGAGRGFALSATPTTTSCAAYCTTVGAAVDPTQVYVAIFGN
jgi:hypothetical protein